MILNMLLLIKTLRICVEWSQVLCLRFFNITEVNTWSYFETFIRSLNSFRIKSRTGEYIGQFSTGPINKAVPSFTNRLTRVRERWWKTHSISIYLHSKKVFTLTAFTLFWIGETIFRLDALALSVIATATWLAGWLAGWVSVTAGIVSKRLNVSENFFDHLIAPS